MPFARWQGHALDDGGKVIENCTITVRRQTVGLPIATLYSDRDGASLLSNPFNITTGSKGYFAFHAAGGAYQITVAAGAFSRTWTYVPIGLAQESDQLASSAVREVLSANRTYYVRFTGDDGTGNGLSPATAFLTIQKAIDVVAALDISIYNVTINVGAGTYNTGHALKYPVGSGVVTIVGAGSTTIVDPPSGVNHCFSGTGGGRFFLQNMKLQKTSATTGHGIFAQNGTYISFQGIEFGSLAGSGRHLYANQSATIACTGPYTVTGNALIHFSARTGGYIFMNLACTLTGTPAFTRFADASMCGVLEVNGTYTGSATGVRYLAELGGVINTAGGGANFLPGNSAGSSATGYYA